jgi:transcriptional regulator with XRE-family HTH domain
MARHLEISYNTFRCWLYNNRLPDAQNACEIAQKLGVTVEYLVSGKEKTATERKNKQSEDRKAIYDRIRKLIKKLEEEVEHLK